MTQVNGAEERWREIKVIHKKYHEFYELVGGAGLVGIGVLIGYIFFGNDIGYNVNLYTTILGVVLTVVFLDKRAAQRERKRFREDLIFRMKSRVNDEAVRAAEELKRQGWLKDGSLVSHSFYHANLSGADLNEADLEYANFSFARLEKTDFTDAYLKESDFGYAILTEADFSYAYLEKAQFGDSFLESAVFTNANLEHADFGNANLKSGWLKGANLRHVSFFETNLQGAKLEKTDMRDTILFGADLKGADLKGANIDGVNFYNVSLDETTVLIDGSNWKSDTDLTKFGAVILPISVKREIQVFFSLRRK